MLFFIGMLALIAGAALLAVGDTFTGLGIIAAAAMLIIGSLINGKKGN